MTKEKYKIGLFTCGLGFTGGSKRILFLAKELCAEGHDVDIILAHPFYDRDVKKYPCPVIKNELAEKNRYDFLMLMNPFACSFEDFHKINAKKRGMYILHLYEPERYTPEYQKWIDHFKNDNKNYIFGNNPAWQDYYDVAASSNAFDLIGGIQSFKKFLKKRNDHPFTVVCHASVVPWKGFHLIQQALNRLKLPSVRLVAFAHKATKIANLRWPVQLFLNVTYDDMPNIYAQGDLFISLEGKPAGWANTVFEAMMCKIPVICTTSGTEAYAKHLENAFIIDRDPTILRDTIEQLYYDKRLRNSLKLKTKECEKLYNQFNYHQLTKQLLKIVFNES